MDCRKAALRPESRRCIFFVRKSCTTCASCPLPFMRCTKAPTGYIVSCSLIVAVSKAAASFVVCGVSRNCCTKSPRFVSCKTCSSKLSFNCANSMPFMPPSSAATSSTADSSIAATACSSPCSHSNRLSNITGICCSSSWAMPVRRSSGITSPMGASTVANAFTNSSATTFSNCCPASLPAASYSSRDSVSSSQWRYCRSVYCAICSSS